MRYSSPGGRYDEGAVEAFVNANSAAIRATWLDAYVGHWVMRQTPAQMADLGGFTLNAAVHRIKKLRRAARKWWARRHAA